MSHVDPRTSDESPASNDNIEANLKSIAWWVSNLLNAGAFLLAGVVLILLLGVSQRLGWIRSSDLSAGSSSSSSDPGEQTHTCPMHPQIRQPGPGRCPICGMALAPAAQSDNNMEELAVNIAPAQRRLANIDTAVVSERAVSTYLRTIGAIEIDESRQATIASYIDGRVEQMFADYTGVSVDKGDHLAVVYSPQLYAAQVEYLEARAQLTPDAASLPAVRAAQEKLADNSRQRLVEWGMTEQQLAELDASRDPKSRVTIYAPIGGTVFDKLAEEGKYVSAGEPIYRIANLTTVWLMLELYPEDAAHVRFGQVVEAQLNSLPGKTWKGRVAFIAPQVDRENRTVGVRVEFKNDRGQLRPGDYAQATIEIPIGPQGEVFDAELAGKWISPMHPQVIADEPGDCPICGMKLVPTSRYGYADEPVERVKSITIPRSALLLAGEHSVVYVETEPGRFELRDVALGPLLKDEAVILEGLKPGEQVATAGNFLIDSQMQLAGKPSLIDPTRAKSGYRNTPLDFDEIQIAQVKGQRGEWLEQLYQAYFDLQRSLADDRVPKEDAVAKAQQPCQRLLDADGWSPQVERLLTDVQKNLPHLHHLPLKEARRKFKPISHAIVTLATKLRGEQAEQPFHHFFCPMVKQGEGDWLQSEQLLSNPYWGSKMLRCGDRVRTIAPPEAPSSGEPRSDAESDSDENRTAAGVN